jgi:hypothetical protein
MCREGLMADVAYCRFVPIPKISDERGSLSFLQPGPVLQFDIRRVYYLYDVPPGGERGAHGHRALRQLMIAVSGSLEVECDDGRHRKIFRLDSPDRGLYICPMIWRRLSNFRPGTVCMVLASDVYDEKDYFRNYGDFLAEALKE